MEVSESQLDELRHRGFVVVPNFLDDVSLAEAQRELWSHFPAPDRYFTRPRRHKWLNQSQFAGNLKAPYKEWALSRLHFHPDLINAAERFLGTAALSLYKAELWAKYSGATEYEQRLHMDFRSHSILVPQEDPAFDQMTSFLFLSDVTEADAPTCLVPLEEYERPFGTADVTDPAAYRAEVPATGQAGSLLLFRSDVLHRASGFRGPKRSRFVLLTDFQSMGVRWGGKVAWATRALEPGWVMMVENLSARQRCLIGFPEPGHPYWTETACRRILLRYPNLDISAYLPGT